MNSAGYTKGPSNLKTLIDPGWIMRNQTIWIVLSAFFIRLGLLVFSDNFLNAEPMEYLIAALEVLSNSGPVGIVNLQQLPLHSYSIAVAVALGSDQLLSARFLSLVFGTLTCFPFYLLVRRLFNKKTAIVALVMFAFWPAHVLVSVLTLPDAVVLFLIICAMYFLAQQRPLPALGALSAAAGFSFLAWMLILPAAVYALVIPGKWVKRLVNGVLVLGSLMFPLLWGMILENYYQPAGGIFSLNGFFVAHPAVFLSMFIQKVIASFQVAVDGGGKWLALPAFAGVALAVRSPRRQQAVYWILTILIVAGLGLFRCELRVTSQAELLAGVMIIPFVIEGLRRILRSSPAFNLIILSVCVIMAFRIVQHRPVLPAEVREVAEWLNQNLEIETRVLVRKDSNGYYSAIAMLSGLPPGNFIFRNVHQIVSGDDYLLSYIEKPKGSVTVKEWQNFILVHPAR